MATEFLITMCKQLVAKTVCNNVFVFDPFYIRQFYLCINKMEDGERELAVMDSHQ